MANIRLNTQKQVNKEMQNVYRDLDSGKITAKESRLYIYCLKELSTIELSDMEKEIERLEGIIAQR